MDKRLDHLLPLAQLLEPKTYYPQGRSIDGSMYSTAKDPRNSIYLITEASIALGGSGVLMRLIKSRRSNGETLADEYCGNWRLWTLLNLMEVSRIKS